MLTKAYKKLILTAKASTIIIIKLVKTLSKPLLLHIIHATSQIACPLHDDLLGTYELISLGEKKSFISRLYESLIWESQASMDHGWTHSTCICNALLANYTKFILNKKNKHNAL